ncbi:MAG: methyl-accepting chemotaxis protein [Negativicutes bacterium]|nr:methyl-accepting chemotaxis protein [Negativicutes bacterium]
MKSIQTKLTVVILSIVLVALAVLGGLNYWKARSIITGNVQKDMGALAVSSANDVGDWLDARKAELLMIAVSPVVQSGNPELIAPYLINAAKANKAYDAIGYAGPTGAMINSLGAANNVSDRDYFQRAMRGETSVSDPVISKTTGHLLTVAAIPVKVDGKVTGVLYGGIDMEGLSKKVLSVQVGATGYALVAQQDGLTIIHPDKEVAMKANPLKDANVDPGRKALTERIAKGEKGTIALQVLGIDRYYAYSPVPGVNWGLAITVPVTEVTGAVSALTSITSVTIVIVLALASVIIIGFARRIARPIIALEAAANRIAAGDISLTNLEINSNDEIGRLGKSFEQMAQNLRTLIRKILGATEQVAASSEELTASAEQSAQAANQVASSISSVAAGANEQLAAANNTSAVVEQMSAGIQHVAANTNQMAAQSAHATDKAKEGGKAVAKAVTQMSHIESTVNTSAKVVAKLGERSKEIGQIVDTISGIAGQTNLLALNAAIEAARAGEQGRGFAVVAEEVRKLAEQSQEAAKKIAELIGEIQKDTDKAVVAMTDGTREVKTGAEVVNAAGAAFQEIAELVTQVSDQVKEISASIQQMASGSQQIVGSVKKIDELSKTSAGEAQSVSAAIEEQLASMEEIAGSSEALSKLAQDLQTAVAQFRV